MVTGYGDAWVILMVTVRGLIQGPGLGLGCMGQIALLLDFRSGPDVKLRMRLSFRFMVQWPGLGLGLRFRLWFGEGDVVADGEAVRPLMVTVDITNASP
ncbi:Protein Mab-21-Like 4 [Manis pentadactyla]|nr:Protein Mab-21-Like 4 [Manis pentadactyla]